jgi:hypothetical protein
MKAPMRIAGREGWYGEVTHADGRAERRRFDKHQDAKDWVESATVAAKASQAPTFGGPSGLTLGQMMGEYAARFTINKGGYAAELTRINHYVMAVGLPRLKIRVDLEGKRFLEKMPASEAPTVPVGFKAHIDKRLSKRERTYSMLRSLACKKVSKQADDRRYSVVLHDHDNGQAERQHHPKGDCAAEDRFQLSCPNLEVEALRKSVYRHQAGVLESAVLRQIAAGRP